MVWPMVIQYTQAIWKDGDDTDEPISLLMQSLILNLSTGEAWLPS